MSSPRRTWRRVKMLLLLVVVLGMINMPYFDTAVKSWKLDAHGVDVTGRVTGNELDRGRFLVEYSIPPGHDLTTGPYWVSLHEQEYDEALTTGELDVRILPGNGVVRDVEGEVEGNLALLLTVLGNLAVLAILAVLWRYGRYNRRYHELGEELPDPDPDPDPGPGRAG